MTASPRAAARKTPPSREPGGATLTLRALNRATLARQMLLAREKTSVVRAVERLVGLQAQLARPPFVGLWTRLEAFERGDLLRAFAKRTLVRATMMRGTLHVVGAKDFVALRPALQPALTRGMEAILKARLDGIDTSAVVDQATAFFRSAPATFDALRKHFAKARPKDDMRALAYLVRMHLPLVQVPADAPWGYPATSDFAVAADWLDEPVPSLAPPHALVLRYLEAFGPAHPGDVQTWSGLKDVREVFEELRPKLATFRDEKGRELFDLPKAPRPPEDTAAPVRYLPEFDNLVLSHLDRKRFVADAHRKRVYLPALQVAATVLVDGFVAGAWKVATAKGVATLSVQPFGAFDKKTRDELVREGEVLLAFLEPEAAKRRVEIAR
jgi:hypothetical protein